MSDELLPIFLQWLERQFNIAPESRHLFYIYIWSRTWPLLPGEGAPHMSFARVHIELAKLFFASQILCQPIIQQIKRHFLFLFFLQVSSQKNELKKSLYFDIFNWSIFISISKWFCLKSIDINF